MGNGSSTASTAIAGNAISKAVATDVIAIDAWPVSQTITPLVNTPLAMMPAWDQPPVRPRRSFGITVATKPPIALETGWLNTDAASSSVIRRPTDEFASSRIAKAAHTALATLSMTTHVRRRRPTSTSGAQRKYQIVGAATTAPMVAMRSTEMPWRRNTYGSATAINPLKAPYGAAAMANNHGGGGARLISRYGRRNHVCERPNSETPMYPRTTSF